MDLNELENVPTYSWQGVGFPTLVSLADYRAALALIRSQQARIRILETVFKMEGKSSESFDYWMQCAKKELAEVENGL